MRLISQTLREILVLLLITIAAAGAMLALHPKTPGYEAGKLEAGEIALELLPENVQWLDARTSAEFAQEHIPGAMLLNEDEWDYLLSEFLMVWDPDATVVVYCSSQTCSASKAVAERLRQDMEGITVYHLKGGWEEWKAKNQ